MSLKPKDSKRPEKHLADDIHTTPVAGLAEALEDSEALTKKGQEVLDEVASSSIPPKARVVPLRDEDEGPVAAEPVEDLSEATGVFATSVDIITNALLVILGKFDESCEKQNRLNWRQSFNILLMVAVALAMGWSVWRIESIIEQQARARDASVIAAQKQSEAAEEMRKLTEALKKTDEKVDEVKKEQEKQPDIAIEPDGKGGAKVVVTPKCKGDPKDCERPKVLPKKPPVSKKPPPAPSPPTSKIEIPIPGATSPKQQPEMTPQPH